MGYRGLSKHKVHFEPNSVFEELMRWDQPKAPSPVRTCRRLSGLDRTFDRRGPIPTPSGRLVVNAWAPLEGRTINGGLRIAF